jgi:DNA-binding transcriptional LysR family regulator
VNLRSVDLNLLVVFEAVVDERSVSRAAERLGLTQSAVSHALARLRKVFGDELVVRGPHGMEPTPRALHIAEAVTTSLGQVQQVIDEQQRFDPKTSARNFTLRVSEYVAPFLLPPLCAALRAEAPGLTLRVLPFHPGAGSSAVEPSELHVRLSPQEEPPTGFTCRRLLEGEFVVLMSRSHPQAGRQMTLARYLELPHVKIAAPAIGTNLIDDVLAKRGLERSLVLTVSSWFEIRGVVASTDLVVAIPRRWVADPAFSEGCVWQPLPLEEVTFTVDLRWRARDGRDPGLVWMSELVARALGPASDLS